MEQEISTTAANEVWRSVVGYMDLYEVSSLGRVRSLDRIQYNPVAATHQTLHPGHIMNGVVSHVGYRKVALRDINGKRKNCSVHRLVAMAFIPNPNNLPFINHKNYNKLDNRVENLEWCTPSYNTHYGRADRIRQENQPNRKDVAQYTIKGEYIAIYKTIHSASKKVGTIRQHVRDCANGKRYSAGGFRWVYVESEEEAKRIILPLLTIKQRAGRAGGVPIEQLTKDGEHVAFYKSCLDAERKSNREFKNDNIRLAIKHPNRTAYGYRWRYVNIDPQSSIDLHRG